MSLLPRSEERVPRATPEPLNQRIRARTVQRVGEATRDRAVLDARLDALNREWDVERALEALASSFSIVGTVLAVTRDRRWFAFPLVVTGFLLQHALQGWCPPLPVLRALGFRTRREIDNERHALKAVRGDYATAITGAADAERLLDAVERD